MKVICINDFNANLTIGGIYDAVSDGVGSRFVRVVNDIGVVSIYDSNRFRDVRKEYRTARLKSLLEEYL